MTTQTEGLQDRLLDLNEKALKIQQFADEENRDLTADESAEISRIFDEFTAVEDQLAARDAVTKIESKMGQSAGRKLAPEPVQGQSELSSAKGALYFNSRTGEPIRVYGRGDRLSKGSVPRGAAGEYLKALLLQDESRVPPAFRNALQVGTGVGANLVPTELSSQIIDLARAASTVQRAGAQMLPMATSQLDIARQTGDPTAAWRAELAAIGASDPAFDQVSLVAKTLAAIVSVSQEWLEDAVNGGQVLEQALASTLATEMDRACLNGSGSGAVPEGLLAATGVLETGTIGTPTDFSEVSGAVGKVLNANHPGEGLSWIASPTTAAVYDGMADSTGQPLQPSPWVASLARYYTTSMPDTAMLVGDFGELLIGMRTNITVEILPSGTVGGVNAVDDLARHFRVYMRMDCAPARPAFFCKLTGIS